MAITVNGVTQISWPWHRVIDGDVVIVGRVHGAHASIVRQARKVWPQAEADDYKTFTRIVIRTAARPKRKYVREDPAVRAQREAIAKRKRERRQWHRAQSAFVDPFS